MKTDLVKECIDRIEVILEDVNEQSADVAELITCMCAMQEFISRFVSDFAERYLTQEKDEHE